MIRTLLYRSVTIILVANTTMNALSQVFVFKIAATVVVWCIPLLLVPSSLIVAAGVPDQPSWMFIRMLGWAYIALCVGYAFGLRASLKGKRAMGSIWVGIVSNGGACLYLLFYGLTETWSNWGLFLQVIGWGSIGATALITLGLILFGVCGEGEAI